ncbi:hypothetical protein NDN08_003200 [Rhodosorus marinus]|uniref:Transcription factor TFIIIC triple barrel domain-containing protein n=1 Tax=Rhodosorus marinus TaxID=101924 RepID=A0AAV8UVT9_9RHOD|nr:hypothetical protein NDN08_003200 [Rhodosorus marinus]
MSGEEHDNDSAPRSDCHLLELANWEDMNVLPSCSSYQLAGFDTEKPLLSVDRVLFEGAHEDVLGTQLYFYLQGDSMRTEDLLFAP